MGPAEIEPQIGAKHRRKRYSQLAYGVRIGYDRDTE